MKSLVAYAAITLALAVPSAQKTSIPAPSKPAAAVTHPTLFLIGDSTVRNGDATGSNGQWGWGEPLVSYFDAAKITVVNRAIGGRSSRTFLTEGRWAQVLGELKAGDFVLMQFGHNDGGELFKSNRPRASLKGTGEETQDGVVEMTGKSETVRTYGSYLRQYVRETKAKGATPVVLSLVPRSMWKDGRIIRAEADYAKWAADVAREEGAAFIDLNDSVAKRYEAIGRDTVETFFPADHTHTNRLGADLNAAAVVEGLKGLPGNPLATYLVPGKGDPTIPPAPPRGTYDVRSFGARGDGKTLDTVSINRAIEAASDAGGGTVSFTAGRYLTFSIRLRSNVTLNIGNGATIVAATPAEGFGQYDLPEDNEHDVYQDFGHRHWKNSLMWGIDVQNVAIVGQGRIDGEGLTKRGPGARWQRNGAQPLSMGSFRGSAGDPEATARKAMDGQGNKAIALKNARHVLLRDFSILRGGHFAVLATGVDDLVIDNVTIDTNRDGLDIDSSRDVRISNVRINSPNDDAIVLKSSVALGVLRPTENVTITNCQVSGYDEGTMLDGTYKRTQDLAPDRDRNTGRIKLGTESSGGFRNIAISNCTFDRSRGLAIEMVDGAVLEDITVTNLTMREVTTAPLFLRLGNRGRSPGEPTPGKVRRVTISNVVASDVDPRYPALIAGIPGHPVEDVQISNVRIQYRGGGTTAEAAIDRPENETAYPEPSMFGTLPSYGLFVRHARGLTIRDFEVTFDKDEARPPVALVDVEGAFFDRLTAKRTAGVPLFILKDVKNLTLRGLAGLPDLTRDVVSAGTIR